MSTKDARFEDAEEAPLNLGVADLEDLKVVSALVQDAVFVASEIKYIASERRFAILLQRFRWEEGQKRQAAPERVQSVLMVDDVMAVASQGLDRSDKEMVYALLALDFETDDAVEGFLNLTLAGDGAIRLKVEALNLRLKDVTRPYLAPSKQIPSHPET